MRKIYDSILECVGNTPLVRLHNIERILSLKSSLYAKVEMFNPTSSIKVRIAKTIIENGLKYDLIKDNTVIIEPTSGNTGVALSCVCALYNLHFVAVMPENMSLERIKLIKAYGGEVILTPKEKGMKGTLDKVEELKLQYRNHFLPSQFKNKLNPLTHYQSTAKEIYDSLDGNIDYFISCIGTGGTITGISKYLKEKNNKIYTIGLEPLSSPLLTKGKSGMHKIQGIGSNFIPSTLDLNYVDEIIDISDNDAFYYAKMLAKNEGVFAGISSGCALAASIKIAKVVTNKNIITIFPDTGERYLSTDLIEK